MSIANTNWQLKITLWNIYSSVSRYCWQRVISQYINFGIQCLKKNYSTFDKKNLDNFPLSDMSSLHIYKYDNLLMNVSNGNDFHKLSHGNQ